MPCENSRCSEAEKGQWKLASPGSLRRNLLRIVVKSKQTESLSDSCGGNTSVVPSARWGKGFSYGVGQVGAVKALLS